MQYFTKPLFVTFQSHFDNPPQEIDIAQKRKELDSLLYPAVNPLPTNDAYMRHELIRIYMGGLILGVNT